MKEQELATRCAHGDNEARKELYEQYSSRILSLCRRYASGPAEAEDLMQDAFVKIFVDAIRDAIHGDLNTETMMELNANQITLLAWDTLHEEVMDGGFVQLIHNGYGPFIFKNPFAKAVKLWGLRELSKLVYEAHTLWLKHRDQIERELTEDEFMALFEQMPDFDELDDQFVESEEEWTAAIAHYIDEHIENFATIE
jgi:hypothetical protein